MASRLPALGILRSFEDSIAQTFISLEARIDEFENAYAVALKVAHTERDSLRDDNKFLRQEVHAMHQKVKDLAAANQDVTKSVDNNQNTLIALQERVEDLKQAFAAVTADTADQKEVLATLLEQHNALQATVNRQRHYLKLASEACDSIDTPQSEVYDSISMTTPQHSKNLPAIRPASHRATLPARDMVGIALQPRNPRSRTLSATSVTTVDEEEEGDNLNLASGSITEVAVEKKRTISMRSNDSPEAARPLRRRKAKVNLNDDGGGDLEEHSDSPKRSLRTTIDSGDENEQLRYDTIHDASLNSEPGTTSAAGPSPAHRKLLKELSQGRIDATTRLVMEMSPNIRTEHETLLQTFAPRTDRSKSRSEESNVSTHSLMRPTQEGSLERAELLQRASSPVHASSGIRRSARPAQKRVLPEGVVTFAEVTRAEMGY